MQKIAFHLNCLEQGGAERVVTNLAHQFLEDGYEVYIATEWKAENEFQIDPRIHRVIIGLTPGEEEKSRITKFLLRISHLRNFIKKERPDVVIAFAKRANYRALMAKVLIRVPVVISVRTDPALHYAGLSDKLQIALFGGLASGCVFQTEEARDFFPVRMRKRSRVILNPVNEKYLRTNPEGPRTKEIMHVGRLVDFKNQPMLIRAFVEVHKKYPEHVLKIFGGDSFDGTREILEDLILQNRAQDYIFLMGASDELEKQIVNGALFVFTSDWEGMPNALMEAMALGLPVIATDCPCGGPRTLIRHGDNGLLIPIKDQKAAEEAMLLLLSDPALAERLGERAKKIRQTADTHAVYEQWRSYLEEICSGNA